MSSGSAIVKLSKSKNRYTYQDKLLNAYVGMPGSTAKEVAKQMLGWFDEPYCDSPKRASDLASKRLGYLEQLEDRECKQSKAFAHTYRVTQKGLDYLRRKGFNPEVKKPQQPVSENKLNPLQSLRECQQALGEK